MPLRKWQILHVNKGKTNWAREGLQDKILCKRMKNKSIFPVSYLLEAIKLQKEEEKKKKEGKIDNDKSLNAIKMMVTWKENVNRYAKVLKKEYSYVYFVLRNR